MGGGATLVTGSLPAAKRASGEDTPLCTLGKPIEQVQIESSPDPESSPDLETPSSRYGLKASPPAEKSPRRPGRTRRPRKRSPDPETVSPPHGRRASLLPEKLPRRSGRNHRVRKSSPNYETKGYQHDQKASSPPEKSTRRSGRIQVKEEDGGFNVELFIPDWMEDYRITTVTGPDGREYAVPMSNVYGRTAFDAILGFARERRRRGALK